MSERQVMTLLKLLDKFAAISEPEAKFNDRERQVIAIVRKWATWYGRDELHMDL